MWKWMVGVTLLILIAATLFVRSQVRKITLGGDSAVVTIAARPDRVFASLANADSLLVWMDPKTKIGTARHGGLMAGDTLHVETTSASSGRQQLDWLVTEVVPDQLIVMNFRADSTGFIFATRRDSLVAAGDSTRVVSTIASPTMDSLRTERGDTGGKVGGALLNLASRMSIAHFRALSEQDLRRLKSHLEKKKP